MMMRVNSLKAQIGYKRRHANVGKPSRVAANILELQLNPGKLNTVLVSDITYLGPYEGFL